MKEFIISKERRLMLGFQLRKHREMKELELDEISIKSGVNEEEIKALENGQIAVINPLILISLADVLGIHYMMFYMIVGYVGSMELSGVLAGGKRTSININVEYDDIYE